MNIAIRCSSWFPVDSGISPSGFLLYDEKDFDDIGLTKIGKKLFVKIFMEVKGIWLISSQVFMHDYS